MALNIRKYTLDDVPALRRIFLASRRKTFSWVDPQAFTLSDFDRATKGEEILVALEDNLPIGFIAWWPPENFIHSLFVDPACTGKGAGKMLLNACLNELKRPATLKCLQANTNAFGFYSAQGWEIAGTGGSEEGDYFLMILH